MMLVSCAAVAGLALFSGCAATSGLLTVDFNGKVIEIEKASEITIRKGNETQMNLPERRMRVSGQQPIQVMSGGTVHELYTTDTTIMVNKKQFDLAQGDTMTITAEGKLEFTAGAAPAGGGESSK
jgi:hypothetical protein